MTLDERIKKDLEELYNNGEISGAVTLDGLVEVDEKDKGLYWKGGKENEIPPTQEEEKVIKLIKSNPGIQINQLAVQAQMTVSDLEGKEYVQESSTSFATRALPIYTGGNRNAKTVMVMLNPGTGVKKANNDLLYELKKRSMFNMLRKVCCENNCQQLNNVNLQNDIDNYNHFNSNYGDWDKNRHDNFDLKQAFFLLNWGKTGIDLPNNLSDAINPKQCENQEEKEDEEKRLMDIKLKAKQRVLMDKLQLELVPYASRSFSSFKEKKKIKELCPYVETLFEEIFSQKREYVIFCSRLFKVVFEVYNKNKQWHEGNEVYHKQWCVEFGDEYKCTIKDNKVNKKGDIEVKELSVSCQPITIKRNNGESIKAIIANTFPSQALPNAYKKMAEYGKFCYQVYNGLNNDLIPKEIWIK